MASTITLYTVNAFEDGTITVTGTPDTGFPEARLYDRSIDFFWKDTATGAYDFKVDLGAAFAQPIDFLAVERHNFNGETLEWQYSTDDITYSDMVTDWAQSGNTQIVKTASEQTKRYWQLTLSSMTNPKCTEIFMSYGYTFNILANPSPFATDVDNVRWQSTIGGLIRSTKLGDGRRVRGYNLFLSAADLTNLKTAVDYLDEYSKPFYICDHAGDYIFCKFTSPPKETYSNKTYTHVSIDIEEIL